MKKNSPRCIALRLLIVLWFAAVCRVSFCQNEEPWKTEQKKNEEVFLCGAADLFVEWNVTFGALHKRAVKVNTTATKILQNKELYKNSSGVKRNASVAIETLKSVLSNTTTALVVSRGFMGGIERDFFNAFEAVKDYPGNFTFGHSNGVYNGKRESEILKFFKNVTMLFVKCKNRTNENVTIDSLEKKTMAEVDNETTNLSKWEMKQRDKWNATLANVTNWLDGMKSYNSPRNAMNVWKNNVSIRDIIAEDCDKIHRNSSKGSKVPSIIDSAYMNVMRHLDDIANKTVVNNSLEENGCESMHKLFQENISGVVFGNVTKSKDKIQEICKKLNETLQNHTCTTNRTSVEWLRHRFNITVPEMIERLKNR
ncbi:hypothetical protein ERJ75_000084200 [Trypanosoma vivax]|uniref:Uncharacterized protein n=1 Tax=Trypanosoma vivax (strain Y486) TaxID=1055687 RepID=F9WUQ1_TRYVY|nr:hypothetical protein ERJ75_000084200 [Trypanosoma vivax]CCD21300.1 hypothetical protein, conserved in T. vivax [Trypanosoma vivax Y486]|eukprot:CCD21300.1 hypothetical protein, conserved in T. vivax [Trypanosoma vivax Y486]